MNIGPLKATGIFMLLFIITCMNSLSQSESPVRIEFDQDSKRIDLKTGKELPDYKFALRGSLRFFMGRLDESEDVIHYFHDGRRTVKINILRSIEKYQEEFAMWLFKYKDERRNVTQYAPRVHTLAVSFIPLSPSTREPEGRVYLLLNDLKLIDWGEEEQ